MKKNLVAQYLLFTVYLLTSGFAYGGESEVGQFGRFQLVAATSATVVRISLV